MPKKINKRASEPSDDHEISDTEAQATIENDIKESNEEAETDVQKGKKVNKRRKEEAYEQQIAGLQAQIVSLSSTRELAITNFGFNHVVISLDGSKLLDSALVKTFVAQFDNPAFTKQPRDLINKDASRLIDKKLKENGYTEVQISGWTSTEFLLHLENRRC